MNKSDEQLAEFVNGVETDAYNIGREGVSITKRCTDWLCYVEE